MCNNMQAKRLFYFHQAQEKGVIGNMSILGQENTITFQELILFLIENSYSLQI